MASRIPKRVVARSPGAHEAPGRAARRRTSTPSWLKPAVLQGSAGPAAGDWEAQQHDGNDRADRRPLRPRTSRALPIAYTSRRGCRPSPSFAMHTREGDGRQWRHVLTDAEITRTFRVHRVRHALHGKSNPPTASWSGDEYQLSMARYTATIRRVSAPRSRPRQARGDGVLDRGPRLCAVGDRTRVRVPRVDRARGRRLPGALVRHGRGLNRPVVHGG